VELPLSVTGSPRDGDAGKPTLPVRKVAAAKRYGDRP
jgi:hypothetical protein